MFSHIFETFGVENLANTDDFCASEAENHSIYDVFVWLLVAKITAFTMFCVPAPSKNTGVYAVLTILQDEVSICQEDKNIVFYEVFASGLQPKKRLNKCSKTVQNRRPEASYNFSLVFPGPGPPKRENQARALG